MIEDALERIQNILNVAEDKLTLIEELTQIQVESLSEKLGGIDVPKNLTYIIVETTISRYRKIGAEGLESKKVDVISNTYSDDLFAPYMDTIQRYMKTPPKRVRVI